MFEAQIPEKSQGKAMRRLGKVGPTREGTMVGGEVP
jgi:hypothetical protein